MSLFKTGYNYLQNRLKCHVGLLNSWAVLYVAQSKARSGLFFSLQMRGGRRINVKKKKNLGIQILVSVCNTNHISSALVLEYCMVCSSSLRNILSFGFFYTWLHSSHPFPTSVFIKTFPINLCRKELSTFPLSSAKDAVFLCDELVKDYPAEMFGF